MNRADVLLLDLYTSLKSDQYRLGERVESLIKLLDHTTLEPDLKTLLWYHWCEMRHKWQHETLSPIEYTQHEDLGWPMLWELDDWFDYKYYYTFSMSVPELRESYPSLFWQNSLDEDQIKQTIENIEAICNETPIPK